MAKRISHMKTILEKDKEYLEECGQWFGANLKGENLDTYENVNEIAMALKKTQIALNKFVSDYIRTRTSAGEVVSPEERNIIDASNITRKLTEIGYGLAEMD